MEELTGYERYQLQWMIEHGYSLEDLFSRLDEIVQESYPSTDRPLPSWAYEDFEEIGFKGAEIWPCQDEWANNEALEEDEEDDSEIISESSNKMDKVCALLGVEPYEKFNIIAIYPNALRDKIDGKIRNPYYFTIDGLVNGSHVHDNHKLANLLNGRFKIEISKEQF